MRFLLSLVLLAGCYNDPTESSEAVRERYIDRHADTFIFTDRARMLEALRGVLAEEGYALVETDRPNHFVTDTDRDPYNNVTTCSVHILPLIDGNHRIQIMEIVRDEKDDEVIEKKQRADLEWLVAQRADPDRALAVMKKASERADKVPPITRKK